MQKTGNDLKYREIIGVLFFFTAIVFAVLIGTGTLTSGIHMVDDHEFLEGFYNIRMKGVSVIDEIGRVLKIDFKIRFRPLYTVLRVLEAYTFGSNMFWPSVINAIWIIVCMIFLYFCGRMMGAGRFASGMFVFISLVGYQSVTWWKLGPQESFASMLFALGLYFMLKWLQNKKISRGIGSLLFFFLMCNYKESYVLLLPFCGAYILYTASQDIQKLTDWKMLFTNLKGKYWYIIALAAIFIYSIVIILLTTGATGYDGFDVRYSLSIYDFLKVFFRSLDEDLKWYKCFTLLFMAVLLTFWTDLKKLWREILLLIVFIAPQFIIYSQTGIAERYMLPCTIGYAWFFTIVILKWKPLAGKRKIFYFSCMILFLFANTRAMLIEADYFRYRGESVTGMLEAAKKLSDEQDINILSCFRPNEEGNLTVYYWMLLNGHDNVYYWTEDTKEINRVCDSTLDYDPTDLEIYSNHQLEEMDVVLMYNKHDRHYGYEPSLDSADFEVIDCGSMTIWIRKGSAEVPEIPHIKEYLYSM